MQGCSALAYRAIPLQSAYCDSKHAIRGFTNSVRTELEHDGSNVHITMVELPAVNTPQFEHCKTDQPNHPQPMPPIFQPEVPARAVYWKAHHRRHDQYLGGSSVAVILANKLFPGLGDLASSPGLEEPDAGDECRSGTLLRLPRVCWRRTFSDPFWER